MASFKLRLAVEKNACYASEEMNALFSIVATSLDGPHAQVRAELVGQRDFSVSDGSRLGDFPLCSDLNELSPGSFWFRLQDPADVMRIRQGETLELIS